jgi:hypothetical protein
MTIGMVLDKSFRLYLENFALLIGLSAILNIPLLAMTFIFGRTRINPVTSSVDYGQLLSGMILLLLAALVITPLITGATTRAVSDIYLGNIVTAEGVLSAAWKKAWTLLKTQFVVGLIVALGFMLLFVPGLLWFLSYALIAPVVMVEGSKNGREIRQRSWGLVKGNRGKVFLIFFVIVVIQILVQGGIAIVSAIGFGAGETSTVASILNGIVSILMFPISAIAITLLYYDFRIRKEGFDLEMLSQAIGNTTSEA